MALRRHHSIWFSLAVLMALVAYYWTLGEGERSWFIGEGGPVETASAWGYFALVPMALWAVAAPLKLAVAGLLLLCGLREYDLDKALFTEGLFKARQYTGDAVALPEKAISFVLLMGVLALAYYLLRRGVPRLLQGLRRASAWAIAVAMALGSLAVAKSVDGLGRKLEPFGITIPPDLQISIVSLEEILELGAPLFIAAALLILQAERQAAT